MPSAADWRALAWRHSWAIDEQSYRAMAEYGAQPVPRSQPPETTGVALSDAVAVVPIRGVILDRSDPFFEMFGLGMSAETIARRVERAVSSSDTKAVILDVDSPGGMVAGTVEAGIALEAIRKSSGKPIVAVSQYMMASAAYWLAASAAHEIVASPSAETGSIGVLMAHINAAAAYAEAGIEVSIIHAGEFKAELADTQALTAEARDYLQGQVDEYYELFVGAVARGRRTSVKRVKADYGQGRMLTASASLAAGLVDKVEPMSAVIERLLRPRGRNAVLRQYGIEIAEPVVATTGETATDADNLDAVLASILEERYVG